MFVLSTECADFDLCDICHRQFRATGQNHMPGTHSQDSRSILQFSILKNTTNLTFGNVTIPHQGHVFTRIPQRPRLPPAAGRPPIINGTRRRTIASGLSLSLSLSLSCPLALLPSLCRVLSLALSLFRSPSPSLPRSPSLSLSFTPPLPLLASLPV